MKKVLMGTSAIALVSAFAAPAAAAEWDVRVGGYMTQHLGAGFTDINNVSSSVGDFDGVDVLSNAEVFFLPSITLDNGIKFGVNMQLEGNTNAGDQIDESYMIIKGSFGEVNIGSENSAGYKMTYAAPDVSFMPINSGSVSAFVPISGGGVTTGIGDLFRGPTGSSFVENNRNNDAQRITYYTPRFAGFQLGVSYARDAVEDSSVAGDNCAGTICNFFDVGANSVNSFGDIDVAVSGRWGIATNDAAGASDPQVYAFGANVGFSGVTIGGAFAEQNNAGARDAQGWSAGISYETGPWGVSASYYHGEGVNNDNPFGVNAGGGSANDETYEAASIGLSYDLAKGVSTGAYFVWVNGDEESSTTFSGSDIEGFIIGAAIGLKF